MFSDPYVLPAAALFAVVALAVFVVHAFARIERLERIAGVRSRRRRRKHLPKQAHIRTVPVRVTRSAPVSRRVEKRSAG